MSEEHSLPDLCPGISQLTEEISLMRSNSVLFSIISARLHPPNYRDLGRLAQKRLIPSDRKSANWVSEFGGGPLLRIARSNTSEESSYGVPNNLVQYARNPWTCITYIPSRFPVAAFHEPFLLLCSDCVCTLKCGHIARAMDPSDSSRTDAVHQVVIIGASYGGIPAAHGLLQQVFPALSHRNYKVIVIAPNDHFYWKIGAPRAIVNPAALPLEKVLLPIAAGFKQYPDDQYEFIHAYANAIDPIAKTVSTSVDRNVPYDSLVIASGTTFASSAWSTSNGLDALRRDITELHTKLPVASSILIGGGGAVGTETAGELADAYGGKKALILLSGSTQLLPRLNNKKVGKDAEARLSKLGVKVIHGLRVASYSKTADNRTSVKMSDGTEKIVDVYIEATGDRPNSSFVPEAWLDPRGLVKTDGATLRVDVPDLQNVYCIGSVGSYSDGSVLDIKFAMKALLESIRLDLIGKRETSTSSIASLDPIPPGWIAWLTRWLPFYGSAENGKRKFVYKKVQADMQFVPIGAKSGVGVLFGWRLPTMVVVKAKSKNYLIANAPKLVNGTDI